MALSQSIATPYGVEATYWTIGKISIDRIKLETEIIVLGYASQEAEKAKAEPLTSREFKMKFVPELHELSPKNAKEITPELIQVFETISKFGYELVKEQEEFVGSTDI